ncbi:hypothetical protein COCOBI_07-6810 [Coccomyxa sp. Obi]|nr:hypothetical protein COCOBI_07-6810 [Coccomyxa sp. Obi]
MKNGGEQKPVGSQNGSHSYTVHVLSYCSPEIYLRRLSRPASIPTHVRTDDSITIYHQSVLVWPINWWHICRNLQNSPYLVQSTRSNHLHIVQAITSSSEWQRASPPVIPQQSPLQAASFLPAHLPAFSEAANKLPTCSNPGNPIKSSSLCSLQRCPHTSEQAANKLPTCSNPGNPIKSSSLCSLQRCPLTSEQGWVLCGGTVMHGSCFFLSAFRLGSNLFPPEAASLLLPHITTLRPLRATSSAYLPSSCIESKAVPERQRPLPLPHKSSACSTAANQQRHLVVSLHL